MTGELPVLSVNVDTEALIVNGTPDDRLAIPPTCHRSTSRCTIPGAFARKRRFGPNGNSYVPLVRRLCVCWKLSSVLLSERFLGFRYKLRAKSTLLSPMARLHV